MRLELNRELQYAIRGLVLLAVEAGRSLSGREIAARTDVPERLLGRVLGRLVAAEILGSRIGRTGGYTLRRPRYPCRSSRSSRRSRAQPAARAASCASRAVTQPLHAPSTRSGRPPRTASSTPWGRPASPRSLHPSAPSIPQALVPLLPKGPSHVPTSSRPGRRSSPPPPLASPPARRRPVPAGATRRPLPGTWPTMSRV